MTSIQFVYQQDDGSADAHVTVTAVAYCRFIDLNKEQLHDGVWHCSL